MENLVLIVIDMQEKYIGDKSKYDFYPNVYAMGATAFVFFAEDDKYSREKWVLSDKLYEVAKKAVSDERDKRQQSIGQLIKEWNAAKAVKQ